MPGKMGRGRERCAAALRPQKLARYGCCLAVVLLVAGSGLAGPSESLPPQDHQYRISVDVNEVVLHATVKDHKRRTVLGLGKENFRVYEDGVLQQIKTFRYGDVPVTVGLVIDNSGSMASKRSDVINAALAFARSSNPRDQIFVVNFNENISFALPRGTAFTDQVPRLEAALSTIRARGETALYDAIEAALQHLKEGSRDKKVLIVISDGGDNASMHTLRDAMNKAAQSNAIIYTIGLFGHEDPDKNPGVLKRLAKITGGQAFFPKLQEDVVPICVQIAHEIRSQYTLAYTPSNAKQDGTYRRIKVKVVSRHGHFSVRTRTGYYAPRLPASAAAGGN